MRRTFRKDPILFSSFLAGTDDGEVEKLLLLGGKAETKGSNVSLWKHSNKSETFPKLQLGRCVSSHFRLS